jgi:REP element-mobilizing transposase RayT
VTRESVRHARRPPHFERFPLHITLRVLRGVPSLRSAPWFKVVKRALKLANARGRHRSEFRITHYSVQGNHLHLVAEASDADRLSRGMQGLAVRIARRLNRALGRRGRLFAERFYARALVTPREIRNVLAYVLLNEQRHLSAGRGLTLPPWYFDACSSAAEFDGWRRIAGLRPPPTPRRDVTVAPHSALLQSLWRQHGLIGPDEIPGRHSPVAPRQ